MEWIVIIVVLLLMGILYWQITIRIGEQQAIEWEEFKKQHAEWFVVKKVSPSEESTNWPDEQKKVHR